MLFYFIKRLFTVVVVVSEVHSGFFYKTAAEREKLVVAERKFVDDRVQQVIKLKNEVREQRFTQVEISV